MQIDNTFIQHYEPMLRHMARQYSKHLKKCPALEEDDLVQEAWLALLEMEEKLSPLLPSPLQGEPEGASDTVLSVASNAMQDAIRRYGGLMEPLERVEQTLAAEEEKSDSLNDEIVRMEQCLVRLSPREQHVLRRLYGLDHQPVASRDRLAQEMGLTLVNLDVIHHRSLERLRQMMK